MSAHQNVITTKIEALLNKRHLPDLTKNCRIDDAWRTLGMIVTRSGAVQEFQQLPCSLIPVAPHFVSAGNVCEPDTDKCNTEHSAPDRISTQTWQHFNTDAFKSQWLLGCWLVGGHVQQLARRNMWELRRSRHRPCRRPAWMARRLLQTPFSVFCPQRVTQHLLLLSPSAF